MSQGSIADGLFTPRRLISWIVVAVLLFGATLYALGDRLPAVHRPRLVGPSTYSRSAIGYAGLAELLRREDIPAVSSENDSLTKLKGKGILVIAEPRLDSLEVTNDLLTAKRILLILPKWTAQESRNHPGWIKEAEPVSAFTAQATLALIAGQNEVVRADSAQDWTINVFGMDPDIAGPVQLVQANKLLPLIASEKGTLLGALIDQKRQVLVLSDPDILSNHGLGKGDNAALALAILDRFRDKQGAIVFDETVHGFIAASPAKPFLLLFRYPFSLATLQAALATALLLWATMGRFGAPEPVAPPLEAGKAGLIRNVARLLASTGDQPIIMQRYVHALIRDLGTLLHAPPGLSGLALLHWLDRVGNARGINCDWAGVCARVDAIAADRSSDAASLPRLIGEAHRWKREMVDGVG